MEQDLKLVQLQMHLNMLCLWLATSVLFPWRHNRFREVGAQCCQAAAPKEQHLAHEIWVCAKPSLLLEMCMSSSAP